MAKSVQKPGRPARPTDQQAAGPEKPPAESIKETIDSILIALSLALVFRGFIVEAFVIPTGSMADTLLGMHRGFVCPDCGFAFLAGLDGRDPARASDDQMRQQEIYCPNCAWRIWDHQLSSAANPDRGGDKILVFKFPYLFSPPQRWDVVVFYNPSDPEQNYIKRLVGCPGEYVQVVDGDIYAGPSRDALRIQRKPPLVQQALWRPVYLNDFLPERRKDPERAGTVPRWVPAGQLSGWNSSDRKFIFQPRAGQPADRLRFQPDPLKLGFHDYFSYNRYPDAKQVGLLNVVWDLRLEAVVFFQEAGGSLSASMNRHDDRFTATFHQDGRIELLCEVRKADPVTGQVETRPVTLTARVAPFPLDRGVSVALQNVDFQASVWVDGRPVVVTADEHYTPDIAQLRRRELAWSYQASLPREAEVPSVWLEGRDKALELWHVSLYRDVYYASRVKTDSGDYRVARGTPSYKDPDEWIVELRAHPDRPGDDEFFLLGDNSPSSSDSRMWELPDGGESYWHLRRRIKEGRYRAGRVPRDHLIGRAFFVYWPAGLRVFSSSIQLVPNVGQMRLIH